MPTLTKPTAYVSWVPNGSSTNIAQPPASISNVGFQPGQPIPAPWFNYLIRNLGQWAEYFDQSLNSTVLTTSLAESMRLIGGGTWSYSVASGALAWSAPFQLAIPSAPDVDNQAAAGQVTLTTGMIAYVQANIPFTTSGDVTSGSVTLQNLAYELGIAPGQTVVGAGIPSGAKVVSISGTSATLSTAATASATATSLTFTGTGALSVKTAVSSAFVPNSQTVVIARALDTVCSVGAGSTDIWLRDQEARSLVTAGYVTTLQAPAGQAIAVRQAVYIAQDTGNGRTLGAVYPADASASFGATRAVCLGFAHTATASGATCHVVNGGFLSGFQTLTAGAVYYLDPTVLGGITSTRPTVANQVIAPVGVAVTGDVLAVSPASGAANSVVSSGGAWPNFLVTTESQLASALASATASGGGVIALGGSFTLSQNYTVTDGVMLQGRKGASVLSVLSGGGLTLQDGCEVRDLWLQTALTSGTLVTVAGNYVVMKACRVTLVPTGTGVGVAVSGSSTRMMNTQLAGVAGASTAVGISYVGGTDNLDESTVILS